MEERRFQAVLLPQGLREYGPYTPGRWRFLPGREATLFRAAGEFRFLIQGTPSGSGPDGARIFLKYFFSAPFRLTAERILTIIPINILKK